MHLNGSLASEPHNGAAKGTNPLLGGAEAEGFGVGGRQEEPTPALRAAVGLARSVGDEHGTLTHPRRGRWPRHPLLD